MRSILTVSLPEAEKKKIEKRAKTAGITVSTYIINVVHLAEAMITEDELLEMSKQAEKDYREGKTKELKSLADLMD